MLNLKSVSLSLLTTVVILISCVGNREAISPVDNPNPWEDDYTAVSSFENYKSWGTYNVHDPAGLKVGDTFYVYSTDAIFGDNRRSREEAEKAGITIGNIQVRKSKDLVNWEFVGWAFPEIPKEAIEHVHANNNGRGATNIWAPFVVKVGDKFRMYYCVSAFGKSISYLGLAESSSPEGPWDLKGCVVKTDANSDMNAIDASVIITESGEHWMHYGSFFGGLYAMQLNPETGLAMKEGDQGHSIARRANGKKDNIEAPEIIYNPDLKKYFLFVSYDPLMTTYNVRVGRSDSPAGPFFDFFGKDMAKEENDYPILTHPYRFDNHPGWAGTGHCGVIVDGNRFYMLHQGRLSPGNHLMDMHVREIFWTEDGWPVVSPQRYAGIPAESFINDDFIGEWEIIRIEESGFNRNLEAGQILWGEGDLRETEVNLSSSFTFNANGKITEENGGHWAYNEKTNKLEISIGGESIKDLIPHFGQDWENSKKTILFTGLDKQGRSVWGKRIK